MEFILCFTCPWRYCPLTGHFFSTLYLPFLFTDWTTSTTTHKSQIVNLVSVGLMERDFVPLRNVEPCHHAEPWGERLQIRPEGCAQTVAHVQRQSRTPQHWCSGIRWALGGVGLVITPTSCFHIVYRMIAEHQLTKEQLLKVVTHLQPIPKLPSFATSWGQYSKGRGFLDARVLGMFNLWEQLWRELLLTSWTILWSCHKYNRAWVLIFHRWHWPAVQTNKKLQSE